MLKTIKKTFYPHYVERPIGAWELTFVWLAILGFILAISLVVFFIVRN